MSGDFFSLLDNCENIFAGTAEKQPRKACLSATTDSEKSKDMLLCSISFEFSESVTVARVLESGVVFLLFQVRCSVIVYREEKSPDTGSPQTISRCIGTRPGNGKSFYTASRRFKIPACPSPCEAPACGPVRTVDFSSRNLFRKLPESPV